MSKKRTIHGIDPYAPGGIEALLAHHRLTFGDAVMQDPGEAPPAAGGETPPAGGETPPAGPPVTPPAGDPKLADWDGKVESLPPAAQKIINDLRKADGDERVAKKTLDAIQKALNPDAKGGEKPTAEALTQALTERETEARQARTELAVYKAASKLDADADALLDSRSFLAKLKDLDPSKTADIDKAIKDAIKDNPKLKLVRAAGTSGANFGGSGESPQSAASKAKPGPARIAAAFANPS